MTAVPATASPSAARPADSPGARVWRRLVRRRGAMVGLAVIVIVTIVAVLAPWIAPYDPVLQNWTTVRKPPSAAHWFGTDELGRDIFSRIVFGARASMLAGVISVAIAIAVGVPLGLLAGYLGRWVDVVISRVTDALLACPFLILAIALAAFLGPSLTNAMIAIGVTATPVMIRLTRGQVLAVRSLDYVDAATSVGNPPPRVALRHILPNVLPALMVQSTLILASAITSEASLSFLGLGQQPPAPSWGAMLNTAQRSLTTAPWIAVWPGAMIFVTVLSFNLLGDGLRDALDPRSR
jgi:peptide/nickel transport system permease protein